MNDIFDEKPSKEDLLAMTTDIVSAFLSKNEAEKEDLPGLINLTYNALSGVQSDTYENEITDQKPAVSIRRSITPEHIICLEDGKKLKMLKRYLRINYDMTPEEYRMKWNLPHDYPMVAPDYAKQRSEFAKTIGLGKRQK